MRFSKWKLLGTVYNQLHKGSKRFSPVQVEGDSPSHIRVKLFLLPMLMVFLKEWEVDCLINMEIRDYFHEKFWMTVDINFILKETTV